MVQFHLGHRAATVLVMASLFGADALAGDRGSHMTVRAGNGPMEHVITTPQYTIYSQPLVVDVEYRGRRVTTEYSSRHRRGSSYHYGIGYGNVYGYPYNLTFGQLYPGTIVTGNSGYWLDTRTYRAPNYENQRWVDPSMANVPVNTGMPVPAQPAVVVDEGREAFLNGSYVQAAAIYERRARERREAEASASPAPIPDRSADRLYGYALAVMGQFEAAQSVLAAAYQEDETLMNIPVDGVELLGSRSRVRDVTNAAVKYAHEAESPEAWELVAILMESEGRGNVGAKMRERAMALRQPRATQPAAVATPVRTGPAWFRMPEPQPDTSTATR